MSLITDPRGWDSVRLREIIRTQREGLAEILERIASAEPQWRDPMSLLTARDLLSDVLALSDRTLATSGGDEPALANVANVQYDAILSGIDLLKSHANVSKVPRPSR